MILKSHTNPTMKAIVNPFTREVKITHKTKETIYELELQFDDLDEWQGFDTDRQYDAHFYYEEDFGFDFCIYPVKNGNTDTKKSIDTNIELTFK